MSQERRACKGAPTVSVRMGSEHAQECQACAMRVRDDMVNHPFFGFAASGCKVGADLATATHAGDFGPTDLGALQPGASQMGPLT